MTTDELDELESGIIRANLLMPQGVFDVFAQARRAVELEAEVASLWKIALASADLYHKFIQCNTDAPLIECMRLSSAHQNYESEFLEGMSIEAADAWQKCVSDSERKDAP